MTHYNVKYIIIYEDMEVVRNTFDEAFKDLESLVYATALNENRHFYPKTIDLLTCGGYVFPYKH